uniref:Biopterin-dependent aromatic amino acid hydroxylase family profile domain-containing protein n=1 Tax=Anser brachyrhynchus TaxID=132585 RepID=A0A8B9CIF6_9AVES
MFHILFTFAPSSRDAQNSGQHKVSPTYFSVTILLVTAIAILESSISSLSTLGVINNFVDSMRSLDMENVPWFPKKISDLDMCANRVLRYGSDLDADHPVSIFLPLCPILTGKHVLLSSSPFSGDPIPKIEFTEDEIKTWGIVYRELNKLYPTHACREYLKNLPLLTKYCGYREDNIPQLEDVSCFLKERTGFTIRPVAGYLSPRDFLAGLAFRVFHCTQYVRRSSDPLYTPELDTCHELLGHVPLLAEPSFAVQKLATCYFFTVEFGLCKHEGQLTVYGAGLLSSFNELKHSLSGSAKVKPFDPKVTCKRECLITTFQEVYFVSESFEEAKEEMRYSFSSLFCRSRFDFMHLSAAASNLFILNTVLYLPFLGLES